MAWPTAIDYQDTVSDPARCFIDPELRASRIVDRTPYGAPLPIAGQYAHIYRLAHPDGRMWAVRLFLRESSERSERYAAITRHLSVVALRSVVPFTYQEKGIVLGKAVFPLVKMDWIDGQPFHLAIEQRLLVPGAMAALCERFLALIFSLEEARVAHGDLQQDNLIVDRESGIIRLLDYDGMFVPELAGRMSAEIGHPAYQHPRRDRLHYGPALDRFSALVFFASLLVLRHAPDLWYRLHNSDNLLFRQKDYLDPDDSFAFDVVRQNVWRYPEAMRAVNVLMDACRSGPLEAPPLDRVL